MEATRAASIFRDFPFLNVFTLLSLLNLEIFYIYHKKIEMYIFFMIKL